MARSRLSTSVTGSCSAHSTVPGSSGSSGGAPSCRGPARAEEFHYLVTSAAQLMQRPPGSSVSPSSKPSLHRLAKAGIFTVTSAGYLKTTREPEQSAGPEGQAPTPALHLQVTLGQASLIDFTVTLDTSPRGEAITAKP